MSDTSIFESGPVRVTQTLVRIGKTSYPVNGIGSVRVEQNQAGVVIFLAIASLLVGLIYSEFCIIAYMFAVVFALRLINSRAKLVIHTTSGDQTALTAWSAKSLHPIMDAIERAVALRG